VGIDIVSERADMCETHQVIVATAVTSTGKVFSIPKTGKPIAGVSNLFTLCLFVGLILFDLFSHSTAYE